MHDPNTKKPALRQLPAAVLRDGDPGSADAPRIVPKRAKLVLIGKSGKLVAGYVASPAKVRRTIGLLDLRVREIERLIEHRFGALRVDTDDAELIAEAVAAHLEANAAALWIKRVCPQVDPSSSIATADGQFWTAERLGDALCLTMAERTALRIRTMQAADISAADAAAIIAEGRRERDRLRKAAARRAAGKPTRTEYLAASASEQARQSQVHRTTLWRRRNRSVREFNNSLYARNNVLHVPAWLLRAFAVAIHIPVNDPGAPPEAARLGEIVGRHMAALREAGRAA